MLLLIDNVHGHPQSLTERYNKIYVFIPANMVPTRQLVDQGVISIFKSYY